jgi:flagellar FliJ protein
MMFQFRFQSILEYRKALEDRIQSDFAEGKRLLEMRLKALDDLRAEKAQRMENLRSLDQRRVAPSDVSFLASYIRFLREAESRAEDAISEMKASLEEKRKELVAAMKDRKIMEELRKRHLLEFQVSEKTLENRNLDEIGVTRFRKRDL